MFQIRTAEDLLRAMVARVVARSELSDLAPGNPMTQILGAVATALEEGDLSIAGLLESFSIDRAFGADLDARAAEVLPDGLARRTESRATGALRWVLPSPAASDIPIPSGSVAARPGNPRSLYVTTAAGIIRAGSTQSERDDGGAGDIPAASSTPGASSNTDLTTVTVLVTTVPGAITVTNPLPFGNGRDAETDDEFRARIRAHTRTLSAAIPEALELSVLGAEFEGRRVISARAWEDPVKRGNVTLYIDDGTGLFVSTAEAAGQSFTDPVGGAIGGEQQFYLSHWPAIAGTFTVSHTPSGGAAVALTDGVDYTAVPSRGLIWLNTDAFPAGLGSGDQLSVSAYTHYTGLIQAAQHAVEGDPGDPDGRPATRAAGVVVTVEAPILRQIQVSATVTTTTDADRLAVVADVRRRIGAYVNGLTIGQSVVLAEIIGRAMAAPGMSDIRIETPDRNVPIAFNEVARLTAGNLEII